MVSAWCSAKGWTEQSVSGTKRESRQHLLAWLSFMAFSEHHIAYWRRAFWWHCCCMLVAANTKMVVYSATMMALFRFILSLLSGVLSETAQLTMHARLPLASIP